MATCCRSRRSLLATLAALSLVCYYVGSSVLWADVDRKGAADSKVISAKSGQEGQSEQSDKDPAQSDQQFQDVKCTGPKCDKYMQLLGLAKSGERVGVAREYCKYPDPASNAKASVRAPSSNDIASLQTCREPTSLERLVSVRDDLISIARPGPGDPALRCELDAVRRGENDNSVTFERTALLDNTGAATAGLQGADFHRLTCQLDVNPNEISMHEEKKFVRYFAHVNRNEEAVKDAREARCKHCLGYNVLILGVDALSRANFQQYLPETLEYLATKMDAVVLRGYQAVGQSNGGTLIPMLTGQHESELPEARRGKIDSHYADEFDIVWKEYERNGYATLFAEDEPDRSTFNAYYHGFEMEPTNHYMRPFWLAVAKDPSSSRGDSESKYCLGARMKHRLAFDYVSDFFDKYKDLKKFAILHHNGLSSDDVSHVGHMDSDLSRLLLDLRDKGHLENTVVFVMSDHGSKDGKPSAGPKQRMDARSPMLLVSLPPMFRKHYEAQAKSLATNAGRLTTPYDLHATLRDLLDSRRLNSGVVAAAAAAAAAAPRAISLFSDVPADRTCATAAVDPHWCTCADYRQQPANDDRSSRAAAAVVDAINAATERHRQQCAPLSVRRVLESHWLVLNEQAAAEHEGRTGKAFDGEEPFDRSYLQLAIVTSPSSAVFEATVLHDRTKGTFTLTDAGAIRVSAAPEASRHCLDDPAAMQYCECR